MKFFLVPLLSVAIFLLVSCGIESFEPIIGLKPPLGVSLSCSNNKILVQWWGFNDETYFEGYNVYLTTIGSAALSNGGGYRHPRSDTSTNIPTIPNLPAVAAATLYSFWIDTYNTSNITLQINNLANLTYFVCIRAYSGTYLIESGSSEVASVFYTNTN